MPVIGLRSYSGIKAGNGFHVVIKDIGWGGKNDVQGRGIFPKVGDQQFHQCPGLEFFNGSNGYGKVLRPSIFQVVPRDRGDDHIL